MNRWSVLVVAITVGVSLGGFARPSVAQSAADEQAIRTLIESHAVAWNRKMRLWIQSVPPGSQIPAPEFNCGSAEEIEKGRHLWPKE